MYRSQKGIITSAVTLSLAALTLAPVAGAQRTTTLSKPAAKAPAAKQRTNKWILGIHTIAAPGVAITGPDFNEFPVSTTLGGGLGIMAGYEVNRAIAVFGSLDAARQNASVEWMSGTFGLVHAELGVRALVSQSKSQSVPYVTAAIGRRSLGSRIFDFDDGEYYDITFSGMMFSFGGGLEYRMSPKLALDGGVELGIGTLNHLDADGDLETVHANASSSIRVRAGLVWRP